MSHAAAFYGQQLARRGQCLGGRRALGTVAQCEARSHQHTLGVRQRIRLHRSHGRGVGGLAVAKAMQHAGHDGVEEARVLDTLLALVRGSC